MATVDGVVHRLNWANRSARNYQLRCRCGWISGLAQNQFQAVAIGNSHVRAAVAEPARRLNAAARMARDEETRRRKELSRARKEQEAVRKALAGEPTGWAGIWQAMTGRLTPAVGVSSAPRSTLVPASERLKQLLADVDAAQARLDVLKPRRDLSPEAAQLLRRTAWGLRQTRQLAGQLQQTPSPPEDLMQRARLTIIETTGLLGELTESLGEQGITLPR